MKGVFTLLMLVIPHSVFTDSHSLVMFTTYIKGDTPFPEMSATVLLDDLTVAYFDSEKNTLFSRHHHKEKEVDTVVDPDVIRTISSYMHADFEERWLYVKHELNVTERIYVEQRLVVCELMDNDQPGPMITKSAIGRSTTDEMYFHKDTFTYQDGLNIPKERLKILLELIQLRQGHVYYPACIKTLKAYLEKRSHQVKRKVKPRVRLIQKKRSVSGWDGVSCLATGFYPRHINLTILRDGEPVPERLTTGGELLPNGDGTYQMRKNLELSGKDLKQSLFTCSVTHLGLDNKLDVHLELGPGEPIQLVVIPVLVAVGLVCVVGAGIYIIIKYRKKKTASPQSGYSEPSRLMRKGEKGGMEKGPIMKPSETSLSRSDETTFGSALADSRLRVEKEELGRITRPGEKPKGRQLAKVESG
ncbi:major histocompatibility complex class I-related gene protein-like [Hoplias malabaricus]|uniref:major histocompatibility complex class I-related gene protein-like n=1 Tax=Hoplias malabaricus TaxID=27720 RepID=UPI003461EAF3